MSVHDERREVGIVDSMDVDAGVWLFTRGTTKEWIWSDTGVDVAEMH